MLVSREAGGAGALLDLGPHGSPGSAIGTWKLVQEALALALALKALTNKKHHPAHVYAADSYDKHHHQPSDKQGFLKGLLGGKDEGGDDATAKAATPTKYIGQPSHWGAGRCDRPSWLLATVPALAHVWGNLLPCAATALD